MGKKISNPISRIRASSASSSSMDSSSSSSMMDEGEKGTTKKTTTRGGRRKSTTKRKSTTAQKEDSTDASLVSSSEVTLALKENLEKLKSEALEASETAISLLQSTEQMKLFCSSKDAEGDIVEFTVPQTPVCGAPVKIFLDAAKSAALKDNQKTWEEGVVCTVGFNEWQLGEAVDVEMTQIPETSWFECTLPSALSAEAFEIDYVFKTKSGDAYENNNQQNFVKETMFPRKTKQELLDEEELKRTDAEDEQKAVEIISRIQSSVAERQEKSFTKFEKYERTIFETESGEKLTQGYATKQKIFWNKAQNPIGGYECSKLKAHVGFSSWMNGVEQIQEMTPVAPSEKFPLDEQNCWFEFIVQVPNFAT